jgi:hypothetical protein
MEQEVRTTIKQFFMYYDSDELKRWRQGDRSLVPAEVFDWKGPGRRHGYGYAEFFAKRYFQNEGYMVLNHFNLLDIKSKYADNNACIEKSIGQKTYLRLTETFHRVRKCRMRIENPDLCIIGPDKTFFVEAKKDKDDLRPPQRVFAILVSRVANLQFILFKIKAAFGIYDSTIIVSDIPISEKIPPECLTDLD